MKKMGRMARKSLKETYLQGFVACHIQKAVVDADGNAADHDQNDVGGYFFGHIVHFNSFISIINDVEVGLNDVGVGDGFRRNYIVFFDIM